MKVRPERFGGALLRMEEMADLAAVVSRQALFRYSGGEASAALAFERAVMQRFGAPFALLTSSCTQALRLALLSTRPVVGAKVYVPCISFVATVNAVLSCGLVPIPVDVTDDWLLDTSRLPASAERVLPVHFDGRVCALPKAVSYVIEDCAHSFGVRDSAGACVGTQSWAGAFSFSPGKLLTAGQGGLLVTQHAHAYAAMRSYHDHGVVRQPGRPPNWPDNAPFAENMLISEPQAAILLQQLGHCEWLRQRLERAYEIHAETLAGVSACRVCHAGSNALKLVLRLRFDSAAVRQRVAVAWTAARLPFQTYDRYFLPDNPILRDQRSLYADGFPWSLADGEADRWHDSFARTRETVGMTLAIPLDPHETDSEQNFAARAYVDGIAAC